MLKDNCVRASAGLLLCALPMAASAHTGALEAMSFAAGFGHPIGGPDHLLAMVAVGLWAAQMGGRAVWVVPGAFVTLMIVGGALGLVGVPMPLVQLGIIASLLVLGGLIATARGLPLIWSAVLVGAFALFHGHAHGSEIPAATSAWFYTAGFALATTCLHGLGIAVGALMRRLAWAVATRLAGGVVTLSGVWLAFV